MGEGQDGVSLLKQLVREHLGTMKLNELAERLRLTPPMLSNILGGKRGTDEAIVAIAEELDAPIPLGRFLLAALADRCHEAWKEAEDVETKRRWDIAGAEYRRFINDLGSLAKEKTEVREQSSLVSLEEFPNILGGKWQVITGDRREQPPKGLGDLMALDVSTTDFMYFAGLRLPPDSKVLSDKIMLVGDKESWGKLLGDSNLLLIGSPAVSLASRKILSEEGATFMFNIAGSWYDRERDLYKRLIDKVDPDELRQFLEQRNKEINTIIPNYMKNGFVDPIEFEGLRAVASPRTRDYGMVAISRNPWSPNHVVVICAGIGGGGTAGAVKLLGSPARFSEHPWGGVFKVNLTDQVPWELRFNYLNPQWDTKPYTTQKYIEDIGILRSNVPKQSRHGAKSASPFEDVVIGEDLLEKMVEISGWLASPPEL